MELNPISSSLGEQKCKRCSTSLRAEFAFCINCGQRSKTPHTNNNVAPKVSDKKAVPPATGRKHITGNQKAKKADANGTLNLPPAILSSLDNFLAKPAVDNKTRDKRMLQQIQTQLLEIQNAEGVEIVSMNRHMSSLALKVPSVVSASKYEVADLNPYHYASSRDSSAAIPRVNQITEKLDSTRVDSLKHIDTNQYLHEVESITTHYQAYLNRLKQLEGLRAAMMEPPAMPSSLLSNIPHFGGISIYDEKIGEKHMGSRAKSRGEESQFIQPRSTASIPTGEDSTSVPVHSGVPIPTGADSTSEHSVPIVEVSATGKAFMWGPIFNSSGSVAEESIYSSILEHSATKQANAEAALQRGSPNLSRKNSSVRESRRGSRESSPYKGSFFGERTRTYSSEGESDKSRDSPPRTPPRNTIQPSNAEQSSRGVSNKEAVSAPLVMFWGNLAESRTDDDEGGEGSTPGTSRHASRAGSFFISGSAKFNEDQQVTEEADLPMWIEALAAETADLREEFLQEDSAVMKQVGDRLGKLDDRSLLLQSQRALLVQYSMDAVVKQYWQRIEDMKLSMGLKSNTYEMLTNGPQPDGEKEDGLNTPFEECVVNQQETTQTSLSYLEGTDSDVRPLDEEEATARAEGKQSSEMTIAASISVAIEAVPPNPARIDRGSILLEVEKRDVEEAVWKEKNQNEDEIRMQELILSLVRAHEGAASITSGVVGSSSSSSPEKLAPIRTGTDHRIGELLSAWEAQEGGEREFREKQERSDGLAMKQWLVAVTAIDKERATRQTLRTLQLEEIEDQEEESGSDEDDSLGAANRQSDLLVESSTIVVPDNNSLAIIKALYRQSCSKMLAFLSELNVDFTFDQTESADFRSEARSKLQFARRLLKVSTNVDHKVALEYRNFLDHCALRRTAQALKLSEAMLQASRLEHSYRERYTDATREFQNSADAQLASTSETVRHITSSKHMQAIKLSAELDLRAQGNVVKTMQADEAKLLLDIRQEQYVLSEVLGMWQARHSRTLHTYSLAFKRLSGLVDTAKKSPNSSLADNI